MSATNGTADDPETIQLRIKNFDCRLVALHKVDINEEQLSEKFKQDPDYSSLDWEYLLGLLERLYIFDVWVSDVGITPDILNEVTQDNDEGQAPFDEKYFDEIDKTQLFIDQPYGYQPPREARYASRVRFFLHYVDTEATLDIAGKHLPLPLATPMPSWLAQVMPYQPPN